VIIGIKIGQWNRIKSRNSPTLYVICGKLIFNEGAKAIGREGIVFSTNSARQLDFQMQKQTKNFAPI